MSTTKSTLGVKNGERTSEDNCSSWASGGIFCWVMNVAWHCKNGNIDFCSVFRPKTGKLNLLDYLQQIPCTCVDDGAGEADVAAHWPLECLSSGQDPHLGVIASSVSNWELFCSKDDGVLKLSSFKVIQLIIDSLSDDNRLYQYQSTLCRTFWFSYLEQWEGEPELGKDGEDSFCSLPI